MLGIALASQGLDDSDPEIFNRSVNMLLLGAYRMAQRTRPLLTQSRLAGGASVIGIASMSSFFGIPIVPGYGAAKTGLVGVTRTLAVAWGPQKVFALTPLPPASPAAK